MLKADASATGNSANSSFKLAGARLGGTVAADVADSNGRISQNSACQTSHGDSSVTGARIGTTTASAVTSATDSKACNDGSSSQTATGHVLTLNNQPLDLPLVTRQGCGAGTPNVTGSPPLLAGVLDVVCNADERNGSQAAPTYGIREGLSAFVLGTLVKTTTGASESRAQAPGPPGGENNNDNNDNNDNGNPNGPHEGGNPGEPNRGGGPNGPGTGGPGADLGPRASSGDRLPFTGSNTLLVLLAGTLALGVGLVLRDVIRRTQGDPVH